MDMKMYVEMMARMTATEQDEFVEMLMDKGPELAVVISTKINIAHQDKYYTGSEAMKESLKQRGHVGMNSPEFVKRSG